MSATEQQIDTINNSLTRLDALGRNNQAEICSLEQKRDTLIAQLIQEEDLLKGTKWTVNLAGSSVYLSLSEPASPNLEKLIDFTWNGHHSAFQLAQDVELRHNDGALELIFKSSDLILPFAKERGIQFQDSGIVAELSKLQREAEVLRTIVKQLGL